MYPYIANQFRRYFSGNSGVGLAGSLLLERCHRYIQNNPAGGVRHCIRSTGTLEFSQVRWTLGLGSRAKNKKTETELQAHRLFVPRLQPFPPITKTLL